MQRVALLGVPSIAVSTSLAAAVLATMFAAGAVMPDPAPASGPQPPGGLKATSKNRVKAMLRKHAVFVPNLGQWQHPAKFVHRSGPMTLFLEDRGWVLDVLERDAVGADDEVDHGTRGLALRMTFEGDTHLPRILAEQELSGHHNYFLGNDETRWRTDVPLYGSVRYESLYPGIDLRLREANSVPEYDLLLQPGADLSLVSVHVEGARGLSMRGDGSLVIETELGPVIQPKPKTWQVDADGKKREVECTFVVRGPARFGFGAPGWDGVKALVIDPGLIWSTFLGGSSDDRVRGVSVDSKGVVTVVGPTKSSNYPTTSGVYDATHNGSDDAFVSVLDPSKSGSAQLLYSTFIGGSAEDTAYAVHVDAGGVISVSGRTQSTNFPMANAYDTTHNNGHDVFVCRLDPSKGGSAQLVYSTYLGGSGEDFSYAVFADGNGVVTVSGRTKSSGFPTSNAYDATHNGNLDSYVSRLDPSKSGTAQLVYSTFLGGSGDDLMDAISVDGNGVVTVSGETQSSNFPTTSGAYATTHNGLPDIYVSRLDPSKSGSAQLVYSTLVGGTSGDYVDAACVDAKGVVTVSGFTFSGNFPVTNSAYDNTHNGGRDVYVIRLDPSKSGTSQLTFSTLLGGSADDSADGVWADANGIVTVAGSSASSNFPTTSGAYDTTHNGQDDAFVSRLDPSKSGSSQLIYSTFLGGSSNDSGDALFVDASGVVTLAGRTYSSNFKTAGAAYDTGFNGSSDAFVSRLDMGVTLYADVHEISISAGGTQKLTVNAGQTHANRSYWIFGSATGTTPGVTLPSNQAPVTIPLVPDLWTDYTIALANTSILTNTKSALNSTGTAQASINVPKVVIQDFVDVVLYHAYLVYDGQGNFYMASNPVPLTLVK